jgi:hypothetical protein
MPSGSEQQHATVNKEFFNETTVKRIDILRREQANRKRPYPGEKLAN